MTRDEVVEFREFPWPSPDVRMPVLVADALRLAVAYEADDGEAAIVLFPRCETFRAGPNDRGLAGIFEVRESSWTAHRHFAFAFGDRLVECAVPRWDVHRTRRAGAELVDELHSLIRHGDAPVLRLVDGARGRELPTTLYLPGDGATYPLVVFAHGWFGHPRKFQRLFRAWADAGYAVAAPAFPLTNDEAAAKLDHDDVVNQPADVRFVIDQLLWSRLPLDPRRIAVAGFSLGAVTALAVGFADRHRHEGVRGVVSIAGRFHEAFADTYAMTETPLLVVHGTQDTSVPYEYGLEVYEAARGPKRLVTIDGGHDLPQDRSPHLDEVTAETLAFWREIL